MCSNSTGGLCPGVLSGLATDRGVLAQGGYVRGVMSANPTVHAVVINRAISLVPLRRQTVAAGALKPFGLLKQPLDSWNSWRYDVYDSRCDRVSYDPFTNSRYW